MLAYREYICDYLPIEEQDRGANDEGYYRFYCEICGRKTEHEDGSCCVCGTMNDPDFLEG